MKDQLADHAKDWLTLLLAGLGITFAPYDWLGGVFLALCGASIARHYTPERHRGELWAVMLAAFAVSHGAAVWAERVAPDWPVQIVMMAAGFASRHAVRFCLRLMGRVEAKSDQIAERIVDKVLPDSKGDGQ